MRKKLRPWEPTNKKKTAAAKASEQKKGEEAEAALPTAACLSARVLQY
jgi:hypothetical protein